MHDFKKIKNQPKWKLVQSINPLLYSATLNHLFAIMFNIKHIHSFQLAQLCRKRLLRHIITISIMKNVICVIIIGCFIISYVNNII